MLIPPAPPPPSKAVGVDALGMTMRFGSFTALDNVSISIPAGSFHALLGENGAGKSTLVKCIMGFYHATSGSLSVGGREAAIASPRDASRTSPFAATQMPAWVAWSDGRGKGVRTTPQALAGVERKDNL